MKYILALLALLLSVSAHAGDSPNYCLDPETNQQWAKMLIGSPDDGAVAKLFALRLGLCQLVGKELITIERASELFEIERDEVVRKRAVEELQRKTKENQGA